MDTTYGWVEGCAFKPEYGRFDLFTSSTFRKDREGDAYTVDYHAYQKNKSARIVVWFNEGSVEIASVKHWKAHRFEDDYDESGERKIDELAEPVVSPPPPVEGFDELEPFGSECERNAREYARESWLLDQKARLEAEAREIQDKVEK